MASTVTVACKLPHGLILRYFDMVENSEPVMGGGMRTYHIAKQRGEPVVIKGYATKWGEHPSIQISGGYALTKGVDADFFEAWLAQNQDHDAVKSGLIFAADRVDYAADKAKERAGIRNGLEPIDPSKPMRGVEKYDGKAA